MKRMKSTRRLLSRARDRSDEEVPQRVKVIKYGQVIRKVGPATFQGGRHTVSFRRVRSKKLEVFLAAAYDPVDPNPQSRSEKDEGHQPMFHAGVLLKAPEQQIEASFAAGAWQYLLVHLAVSKNTVCIRLELSQSLHSAAEDISNVHGLSPDARTQFMSCGTAVAKHLETALQVARSEVAKPVFALSRLEEDTSCLHFAMRLLFALGCMPSWEKVMMSMPDAPLRKSSIEDTSHTEECSAKL